MLPTTTGTPKSFWSRPEGKMGMLMLIPIIGLLVWGGVTLLPFVLLALQNTIYTVALGFVVLVLGVVLLDPKFWSRLGALYTIAMRWFTSFIVELDPIAIIKGHLETLAESLRKMEEQLVALKGQETKLHGKIQKNNTEISKLMESATKAKQLMDQTDPSTLKYLELRGHAALESTKASKTKDSNDRLQDVYSKIYNLRKFLEKQKAQADYVYKDMTFEVQIKEEEFKAIGAGHKAFKQAMNILKGDSLSKELYDESMEFIATDLGNKIGEIERYIEISGSMVSMDVNDALFEEKGLKLIEEWESKGNDIFLPKVDVVTKPTALPASSASFVLAGGNSTSKSKYLN